MVGEATSGDVRAAVRELTGHIGAVQIELTRVGSEVATVQSISVETRSKLDQLQVMFDHFTRESERRDQLERAEVQKGTLSAEIDRRFGYQEEVRRSAAGTLKSLDEGLVYQENLTNILQNVYVKASGYWLSPALVALSEWTNGNREYCDRAIAAAYRRNPSSTSLFFALITRRQGRPEAALRWLKHYLQHQDPNRLTSDFAIVLEAVAQGAFTAAGRDLVQQYLVTWREQLLEDPEVIKTQVSNWTTEVHSHIKGSNSFTYSALADLSPEWGHLDRALRGAQSHQPLFEKYSTLLKAETRMTNSLEDRVDDILDRLVRDDDPEEVPYRKQLAKIETIIAYDGRVDDARAEAELAAAAFDETKDYLTVQTMSALRPESLNVSRATQKVAIGACADWFQEAYEKHTTEYRSFLPSDVSAKLVETHSVSASTFKLPVWSSSFNRPLAELEGSLATHWDRHMAPWLDALRYDAKKALVLPGVVAAGVLLLFGLITNFIAGFIMAALVFGIWALVINNRKKRAEQNLAQAQVVLAEAKRKSLHKLRDARSELTDWQTHYKAQDANAAPVGELINAFRGAGASSTSSLEHRVVNTEGWI